MENWQSAAVSWAGFLAFAAAYLYYTSRKQQPAGGKDRGRATQRAIHVPRDDNKQKGPGEGTPRATKKATKSKPARKAKKAAKETEEKVAANMSANSSTTGGEGDDDLSPAVSPKPNATATKASGRDVSDMLEPKATSASVLRLTEPTQPVRERQAHQPRIATLESKKQRQNKKKVEEKKLQREQEEKERKALEEKQRRTAREARGEPAKNGLQQAKTPTSNAWNLRNGASNTAVRSVIPESQPLLDTFDPVEQDRRSTTSSSEGAPAGSSATTDDVANNDRWMSEEEQMRLAMADSQWTTVPKGRKAKKPKGASAEGSENGIVPVELPASKPAPAPPANKTQAQYTTSAQPGAVYHPLDSDWAV
ncbi:uncharacterized protein BDZ99DRAFT_473990 [Mytilinidion resinicola]|uniref:Uncharacterized protein n=1 Tax=Mytilinidion resinicola TaxID=574789 RepID=A0A6A6YXT8_9PEZI|nr:uncharacterized protein BDZ99DRAFT_473990 [Mytilinidion resinicola]KAF2813309.1 hypothetical protein BDZ99DRAFT_473990 [Mytilinidion resinicola]